MGGPSLTMGPRNERDLWDLSHIYPQASISGGDFLETSLAWPERFHGRYFFADFCMAGSRLLIPIPPLPATFCQWNSSPGRLAIFRGRITLCSGPQRLGSR